MTGPARQLEAMRPLLRMRLSLRWKAFGMLLLLLGVVHAFYGVYAFHQAIDAFTSDERQRMQRSRQMFEGLLQQSAQNLGRIGAQLASGVSADDLARHPLDESRISPELLASLSGLQLFDPSGQRLGGLDMPGSAVFPAPLQARQLAAVRREHRPASTLWCGDECAVYVFEPAFDRDGREILVGLSQPASELLAAFSRQSGIDVALLSEHEATDDALLQRRLYAITNAPTLLPRLRTAAATLDGLPPNQTVSAGAHGVSLMLLLTPLSPEGTSSIQALFISDESPALARIGDTVRKGVGISLGGLLLSAGALWWFLTPLSRRLWRITRALPMLADKRFNDAATMLGTDGRNPPLADELDLLNANARWLTQRLKQLDSAEAASAAKSRFLATLSHEVRTPLNGILGMLELLQHSQLDPGQRESLGMVRDSAQSLLGILDDTIDLARIEAGRIDIVQAPFSIEQVMAACAETAAPRARAKGLRLLVHTDPGLPQRVMGDALRLRQVLNNLCSNAVKFTASGRVLMRAELAGRSDSMLRVRFSVLDSGIGIAPEHQQGLFQPFQQGDSSTTARYGGAGLGLSICQGLVRRMGGRIGFVSNPGAGSEFSFWLEFAPAPAGEADTLPRLSGVDLDLRLPDSDERAWISACLRAAGARIAAGSPLLLREDGNLDLLLEAPGAAPVRLPRPVHRTGLLRAVSAAAGRQAAAPPPPATEVPLRRLRILAVDDHPTNREVIQRQLALLGHSATTAADAQQALCELGGGAFDLLLTDLRMPGMDGMELVAAIREQERRGGLARRLPAILLSAQLTPDDRDRCLASGMDACLAKPLTLDALRQALAPWSGLAAATDGAQSGNDGAEGVQALDRAVLSRLLGGDQDLADLMLEDFLKVNTPLVPTLAVLADAGDCEGLAAAAHRLLGSARTVGAAPLAQALAALEQAARLEQRGTLPALAAAATQRYGELRKVLERVSA
jgi:signal transduction histidine kinase/HPt (histidine-containing phosphotransfer) domain-containing protein/ActR/RegA family two-component response regulator